MIKIKIKLYNIFLLYCIQYIQQGTYRGIVMVVKSLSACGRVGICTYVCIYWFDFSRGVGIEVLSR